MNGHKNLTINSIGCNESWGEQPEINKKPNSWRRNEQKTEPKKEQKKSDNNSRRFTFTKKDPNTMDINRMTPERHAECMQKGLCFGCGKQGHLGKDCPDRAGTSKQTQTKRYNGKELHQHIRSLLKDMNDEEIQ